MGVVDTRNQIHEAAQIVVAATRFLRQYLDAPMHGQVPDWDDVVRERQSLGEQLAVFDELLADGMGQEWPK
jgi:hypothetical protein